MLLHCCLPSRSGWRCIRTSDSEGLGVFPLHSTLGVAVPVVVTACGSDSLSEAVPGLARSGAQAAGDAASLSLPLALR
eukprot:2980088-Rhodomonas_salina.1